MILGALAWLLGMLAGVSLIAHGRGGLYLAIAGTLILLAPCGGRRQLSMMRSLSAVMVTSRCA